VSGTYVWQEQLYDVTGFEITGLRTTLPPAALAGLAGVAGPDLISRVNNNADTYTVRVDSWLLPFLNVYGILGTVEGEVDVTVGAPFAHELVVPYDGLVYGGGAVLAVGYKNIFLLNNFSFTITDLDRGGSVNTWIWAPTLGFNKGKLSLWTGPTYQNTDRKESGSFDVTFLGQPLGVDYDIQLTEENNWNYSVGGRWDFDENWALILEGGFGDRKQALVSVKRTF